MNLNKEYQKSTLKRVLDFLFAPKIFFNFSETLIGKYLTKIYQPEVSVFFAFLACFLVIYQSILPDNLGNLAPFSLIIGILFSDKKKIVINKTIIWYLFFLSVGAISSVFALGEGYDPTMLLLGWLLLAQFGFSIVAGMSIKVGTVLKSILGITLPVIIYGIYQFFTKGIETNTWVSQYEAITARAFSFVENPNIFGLISVIGFLCSIFLFLTGRKKYIYLTPIYLIATGLSFSRTAWLSLGIALFLVIIFKYRKKVWFLLLGSLIFIIPSVRERIFVIGKPDLINDSSLDGRIWAAKNALFIWQKKPIFGFGPGSYGGFTAQNFASSVYHEGMQKGYVALYFTDGQWTQTIVQTGIIGLFSLIGFFVSLCWNFIDKWRKNKNVFALAGLVFTNIILVAGFTSNILEFGSIIIPTGILIGSALSES